MIRFLRFLFPWKFQIPFRRPKYREIIEATLFGERQRVRMLGVRGFHTLVESVDGKATTFQLILEQNVDPEYLDDYSEFRRSHNAYGS